MASNSRPTKAERLEEARARARAKREEAEKARKRRSLWIRLGVIVGAVVVVLAVVGLVYVNRPHETVADTGAVPAHGNQYGGVTLTSPTTLADSPKGTPSTVDKTKFEDAKVDPNKATKVSGADADAKPAQVVIYVDVLCPYCKAFEDQYGAQVQSWLKDGKVQVQYRIVSFLDSQSTTNYSSRGANALACVANAEPKAYLPFVTSLFKAQDEGVQEGGPGLTNAQLGDRAVDSGAPDSVKKCIDAGTYRTWAAVTNGQALADSVQGTPTVAINGTVWDPDKDADFTAWADKLITAADK